MFRTWSFWKTFFTAYLALVAGIWGFVEAYTYFESDSLKQLLGSNWWIYYYLLPLFIAFSVATLTNAKEETQAETLDQRNRRVMLDHVENFWVKGVLEKSLHGAALLELGIKEDPNAVNYPWTIKKESTDETLPVGKSMLEIFQEIGLGRSLLILGAPGSGKTTMLLELTRQLIEHARHDETEPIPVVFNLASWKEIQSLADWLIEQLNLVYYVPKKTAPVWVNENRMSLLLDGLDEVKADYRAKCVEAINEFRKEHGLTSLVVCSRIEEYSMLKNKLSLEGAISIQSLTNKQVNAYFDLFGKSLASAKQMLNRDEVLQELAETPLMLSIMELAYKDKKAEELGTARSLKAQRKHLFNTYIARMFERSTRKANSPFTKEQTLHYLSWLARAMIHNSIITYQIESMQPSWLDMQSQDLRKYVSLTFGRSVGLTIGLSIILSVILIDKSIYVLTAGLYLALLFGLIAGIVAEQLAFEPKITMVDRLKWLWERGRYSLLIGLLMALLGGLRFGLKGLNLGLLFGLFFGLVAGLSNEQIEETSYPGQRLRQTLFNALLAFILFGMTFGVAVGLSEMLLLGLIFGLISGLFGWLIFGGAAVVQHNLLRFALVWHELLPWRLVLFLEHAVDLIFLRRVGGSYIFVHRLLMEHFAEMDV